MSSKSFYFNTVSILQTKSFKFRQSPEIVFLTFSTNFRRIKLPAKKDATQKTAPSRDPKNMNSQQHARFKLKPMLFQYSKHFTDKELVVTATYSMPLLSYGPYYST